MYTFMPTANSTAKPRIALLLNSAPMNTISVDISTSSTNVLALLACGCQVISPSYALFAGLTPQQPPQVPQCSAVPVDCVVHQGGQRLPTRSLRQVGQLVAGLHRVARHRVLGLRHSGRLPQQP